MVKSLDLIIAASKDIMCEKDRNTDDKKQIILLFHCVENMRRESPTQW